MKASWLLSLEQISKIDISITRFIFSKYLFKCCRCEAICGPESPDRLTVPNVSKGGVIGAMARSNFLMTRRKVLKVKILR